MRTIRQILSVILMLACLTTLGVCHAQMPDNPGSGGGNGGGNGAGKKSGPSYQIIPLDTADGAGGSFTGSAYDINLSRLVVGSVDVSAAYWTVTEANGAIQSVLHFLDDASFVFSSAYGCNEKGEVVGEGGNGDHPQAALYWSSANAAPEKLHASLDFRAAQAVNNNSVICGWSASGFTEGHEQRALVWSLADGQWKSLELKPLGDPGQDENGRDLPDRSVAVAISDEDADSGLITIAGYSNENAVIWIVARDESGGLVAGPALILDPGTATGVNNRGTVCGYRNFGVVWMDGGMAEPLALDNSRMWNTPQPGFPDDVNDKGTLVGDNGLQAVLWPTKDSPLIVLDDFLPKGKKSPFASLTQARAVSEADEIVGNGSPDGGASRQPFLAVPD